MVLPIQKTQNKDSVAMHLKSKELGSTGDLSRNRKVNVKGLSEEELTISRKFYSRGKEDAKNKNSLLKSKSTDEQEKDNKDVNPSGRLA